MRKVAKVLPESNSTTSGTVLAKWFSLKKYKQLILKSLRVIQQAKQT